MNDHIMGESSRKVTDKKGETLIRKQSLV